MLFVRSAAADEFAAAYQSECRPGGPYGALKLVSAAADEFAAAHQSECAAPQPGGLTNKSGTDAARPYGALKLVSAAADEFAAAYKSECRPEAVRSAQTSISGGG